MKRNSILTGILTIAVCLPASATIINIPDDYETIQEGIDASSDGDTVLVQPGTYVENVNFNGHNIVLGSLFLTTGDMTYIASTVIDGNSLGTVVTFENGEDTTTVITGLTIENGFAYWSWGGGIRCESSDPVIRHNIIRENSAHHYSTFGGGIACFHSDAIITNNVIIENTVYSSIDAIGGGIGCWGASPIISGNIITGNSGNAGGGIGCYHSNPRIGNNTIVGNSGDSGAAIYCRHSNPIITNTICWANYGETISVYNSSPYITYCDIQDGWGAKVTLTLTHYSWMHTEVITTFVLNLRV